MLDFDPVAHAYRWQGRPVPNVTNLLRPLGGYEWVDAEVLERKGELGKAIHLATHLDDLGALDESSVSDGIAPYLEAWRKFRREVPCEWAQSERPLYSQAFGYAGTPDRCGTVRGDRAVVDVKSVAQLSFVTGVQLAAYRALAFTEPARRYAVQLKPNGNYVLQEYQSPDDWMCFVALLTINSWKGKHK